MDVLFKHLILWYLHHKRDLPWRETQDPYQIWLSEIILQQTRVSQGLPYFQSFINHFPTLLSLAEAKEDQVLKLWQGLGYYSRARNMHAAAQRILQEHKGVFPLTYSELRKLPGIGDYTACAILSFAHHLPYPVLDGNVARVVSRILGIKTPINQIQTQKEIKDFLQKKIDLKQPDLFNQAMMEWGATLCLPGSAALCLQKTDACFFCTQCYAFKHNIVADLPIKTPKRPLSERYLHYCYIPSFCDKPSLDGSPSLNSSTPSSTGFFIHKRQQKDIWKGLYELPYIETSSAVAPNKNWEKLREYTHILTHQRLHLYFYLCSSCPKNIDLNSIFWVPQDQIEYYAVPKITERFFYDFGIFKKPLT